MRPFKYRPTSDDTILHHLTNYLMSNNKEVDGYSVDSLIEDFKADHYDTVYDKNITHVDESTADAHATLAVEEWHARLDSDKDKLDAWVFQQLSSLNDSGSIDLVAFELSIQEGEYDSAADAHAEYLSGN